MCLIPAYLWQLLYPGAGAGCVSVYIYHVVTLGSGGFGNLEPLIVVSGAGFPLIIRLFALELGKKIKRGYLETKMGAQKRDGKLVPVTGSLF